MQMPLEIHLNVLPIVINLKQAPDVGLSCRAPIFIVRPVVDERPLLELDALLGTDSDIEWMFDFAHLGDEIGGFD